MRRLLTSLAIIFIFLFISLPVIADSPNSFDAVVTGTGVPANDLEAVQLAVNNGGKVLLKGHFNFGLPDFTEFPPFIPSIYIEKDVQIYGETDNKAQPITKIFGGMYNFLTISVMHEFPYASLLPPKIEIRNIHFDGAVFTPLLFTHTSGAVISGNKITNITPLYLGSTPPYPGFPFFWNIGIAFDPGFVSESYGVSGVVTGCLDIEDNQIDMDVGAFDPENVMGQGIFAVSTAGAIIQINGNKIENVTRNAIECLNNLPDAGIGSVSIKNNTIYTPISGPSWPSLEKPNGIVVGWFDVMPDGPYSEVSVEHNYIEALSGPWDDSGVCIIIMADGVVVKSNRIILGGAPGATGIAQVANSGLISNNRIEGSGWTALAALTDLGGGDNNTFWGNNVANFNPYDWGYDVFFGGDFNVLTGGSGTVLDLGVDNETTEGYAISN